MAGLTREVHEETGMELTTLGTLLLAQDIFAPDKNLHAVRLTYKTSATGDITISEEHDMYKWMTLETVLAELHVDTYLREVLERL